MSLRLRTFSVPEIELTSLKGKSAKFPLTSFNASFMIGEVPECTVSISPAMIPLSGTTKQVVWTDEDFTSSSAVVRVRVILEMGIEKTIEIFYGSVSAVSRSSSMNGQGSSLAQIGLTLKHPINRLALLSPSRYVYAPGSLLRTTMSMDSIVRERVFTQDAVLGAMNIPKTIGQEGGRSNTPGYNLLSGIKAVIRVIGANMAYDNTKDPLKLTVDKMLDLMKGSISIHQSIPRRDFMDALLNGVGNGAKSSDVLTALISVLHSLDFLLLFIPNSTREVLIAPNTLWVKDSPSRVFEMSEIVRSDYVVSTDIDVVGPDMVYVSGMSRELCDNAVDGNPTKTTKNAGAYLGSYPKLDTVGEVNYKVMSVPAPTWSYEMFNVHRPVGTSVETVIPTMTGLKLWKSVNPVPAAPNYKGTLNGYAKAVFAGLYCRQNSVNLLLDASCIDILPHLGKTCEAKMKNPTTDGGTKEESAFGMLTRVSISYASDGDHSQINVVASLTGARTKALNDKFAIAEHPIYL